MQREWKAGNTHDIDVFFLVSLKNCQKKETSFKNVCSLPSTENKNDENCFLSLCWKQISHNLLQTLYLSPKGHIQAYVVIAK